MKPIGISNAQLLRKKSQKIHFLFPVFCEHAQSLDLKALDNKGC